MRVISLWQPYAHFIIHGSGGLFKDVENRPWRTSYRGRIAIHAGLSHTCCIQPGPGVWPAGVVLPPIDEMFFGGIVGYATLVDVVRAEVLRTSLRFDKWVGSPWAFGPWCWLLEDPDPCIPIVCRGFPGLFRSEAA